MSQPYKHNYFLPDSIRYTNTRYNENFIESNELHQLNIMDDINLTLWFLNIHEPIKFLTKMINIKEYSFVDLGCGSGLLLIYLYLKPVMFENYSGVEINSGYTKPLKQLIKERNYDINVELQDVSNYRVSSKKTVFFMFNPFGWDIIEKFIRFNLDLLNHNQCFLIYVNDHHLNEILSTFNTVSLLYRDNYYNKSILRFGQK